MAAKTAATTTEAIRMVAVRSNCEGRKGIVRRRRGVGRRGRALE